VGLDFSKHPFVLQRKDAVVEKTAKSWNKYYLPLRLTKADLEEIVWIFGENAKTLEITVDEYKLADIAEIDYLRDKQGKDIITSFKLEDYQPYVQELRDRGLLVLELSKNTARLYVSSENNLTLRGLAAQIDSILINKQIRRSLFFNPMVMFPSWTVLLSSALVLEVLYFRLHLTPPVSTIFVNLPIVLSFSVSFWAFWSQRVLSRRRAATIMLTHSQPNFFVRNKDALVVNLLTGVVCAVIGAIIGYLLASH
jgi:hypothetical protein